MRTIIRILQPQQLVNELVRLFKGKGVISLYRRFTGRCSDPSCDDIQRLPGIFVFQAVQDFHEKILDRDPIYICGNSMYAVFPASKFGNLKSESPKYLHMSF